MIWCCLRLGLMLVLRLGDMLVYRMMLCISLYQVLYGVILEEQICVKGLA